MSALVEVGVFKGLVASVGNDAEYDKDSVTGAFLPGLRFASKEKTFQGGKKRIASGRYYVQLGKDDAQDLGDAIDVLPLARRRKAMDFSNRQQVIVSHDPESVEFKRIEAAAQESNSDCSVGTSFLIWERKTEKFYELFCATAGLKAAAREIAGFLPLLEADCVRRGIDPTTAHGPEACSLASKFRQTKYGTQFDPTVAPCSTPFATLPEGVVMVAEMKKFIEAKSKDVEAVAEAPSRDR